MHNKKRFNLSIVLLITAFFFLISNLSAQQRKGQGPPPIPNETQIIKMVDDLSSQLLLSDDQKTEILALYQNYFAEVKSSMNGEQRPSREKMESLKEEFEDDVKSLLTDVQQDAFDEFQKTNKSRNRQKQKR